MRAGLVLVAEWSFAALAGLLVAVVVLLGLGAVVAGLAVVVLALVAVVPW